ncbi:peptide/nickel transport system permease protein [Rhizobium leguminosarum]|uniref:Peptide/nickel transport system permease protein n=1 Tax=Rhizobium leguminosarum TaxID=384 RepID=A0AAE2MLU6_RHILE|nr:MULTISPECIES: ABC transporter permease [Rhizobium]MBB4291666.1 peptide/nickel transport system permease protein [Rhizobium leguminosarum]MBB4298266.1 peptide/nickel transport system permease protein [Rhizobium leguminosarum]MBB4309404.1 peptide/nickel transport system permease protein [Rhizobium leguminosarum]MBB4418841.1 peptide/nickel transport system permease protein [Rhizobium leguminosarum]MBB4433828.1 peptide/nickel transport system permease protein [Rhizobium esperanzae]
MSTVETRQEARPRKGRAKAFAKALGRFLFAAVTTYLGLLAVTFFIGRVVPIDPVLAILGDRAPNHVVERVRQEMGFNLPLYQQFFIYIKGVLSGDFGNSVLTTNPVMVDIRRAFPATIELATLGTLIGAFVGVPLGVLAAVRRGSIADQVVRVVGLIGYSVPIFWLALISLVIFYAQLRWVAFPGRIDIVFEYTFTPITGFYLLDSAWQGQWDVFYDVFRHIILPASLLGYFSLAYISRMTRSFMLNELSQEYIVAARAKGLSETRVIWGHALRNAAVPLVTVIALSYAGLLEGSVLTETVFSWPGIGLYITNSLQNADMNAVLGGTIVIGTIFIGINLLSDLLYRTLDPRTRNR